MFDGSVLEAGTSKTYGKYIIYGNGVFKVMYAHLSKLKVTKGKVKTAQVLANSGNTGLSTGPHVHVTVWYQDVLKDPLTYIAQ